MPSHLPSLLFGGVMSLLTLLHVTGALGPYAEYTFVVLSLGGTVAFTIGHRRYGLAPGRSGYYMLAAMVAFLAGGALRTVWGTVGDLTAGRSLAPDAVTLTGYGLLALWLLAVIRAREAGHREPGTASLDALIAATAATVAAWAWHLGPQAASLGAAEHVVAVLALYPASSVFLLAIVVRVAWSSKRDDGFAVWAMVAALSAMFFGDAAYLLAELGTIGLGHRGLDVPYALAYTLAGAAALHPSIAAFSRPTPDPGVRLTSRSRLLLLAAAFLLPALVVAGATLTTTMDRALVVTGLLVLGGGAARRMLRTIRSHDDTTKQLRRRATHDTLTGLANREALQARMERLLDTHDGSYAVLFMDLDRFKYVNDSLGHARGDQLLVEVADRLRAEVRRQDLVARIGGDEFVVVVAGEELEATTVAERILDALARPFLIDGHELHSGTSIGIAYARRGDDTGETLRNADIAMYEAKERGRGQLAVFDAPLVARAKRRLALESRLHDALPDGLTVHFQPLVSLEDGTLAGFEALLRWNHPTFGSVPPDEFIPIAEDNGLILPFGAWVIDQAAAQVATWRQTLHPELFVAVNVCVRQLRDGRVACELAKALDRYDLPADALRVEITESALLDTSDATRDTLDAIHALGVKVALDDFGTGYSSLAYLTQYEVDQVKIDRSFVNRIGTGNDADDSLVEAIVAMAQALGLSTTAEGVETVEQQQFLQAAGCTLAQGYLYSPPLPAGDVPAAVASLLAPAVSVEVSYHDLDVAVAELAPQAAGSR